MPLVFTPLTDTEWDTLRPLLGQPAHRRGRRCDARARMDAIFLVACHNLPWRLLPAQFGRWESVARHFRRLDDAGVWERLLRAVRIARPGTPLAALRGRVCRACRKLHGARRIRIIWLARALGMAEALPAPPEWCADPIMSVFLAKHPPAFCFMTGPEILGHRSGAVGAEITMRMLLHNIARGPRWVPRWVRLAWWWADAPRHQRHQPGQPSRASFRVGGRGPAAAAGRAFAAALQAAGLAAGLAEGLAEGLAKGLAEGLAEGPRLAAAPAGG